MVSDTVLAAFRADIRRLTDERDAWRLEAEKAQGEADRLRDALALRDQCISELETLQRELEGQDE